MLRSQPIAHRGSPVYQQRYRQKHPDRVAETRRIWRKDHPVEFKFMNQRNKLKDKLAMQWLRQNRPDVIEACRKQAWQMMPIGDLEIERASVGPRGGGRA